MSKPVAPFFILLLLIAGCGSPVDLESFYGPEVLGPDDLTVAFFKSFHYFSVKATVFDPGGSRETKHVEVGIYTYNPASRRLAQVASVDVDYPYLFPHIPGTISWEDDMIAYAMEDRIYIVRIGDHVSEPRLLTLTGEYFPRIALSGDGERLFYQGYAVNPKAEDRGIYSVDIDSGEKRLILSTDDGMWIDELLWDREDERLLLSQGRGDQTIIWSLDPETGDLALVDGKAEEFLRRRPSGLAEKLTGSLPLAMWDVPAPEEVADD